LAVGPLIRVYLDVEAAPVVVAKTSTSDAHLTHFAESDLALIDRPHCQNGAGQDW
jgi:hypothetical protein